MAIDHELYETDIEVRGPGTQPKGEGPIKVTVDTVATPVKSATRNGLDVSQMELDCVADIVAQ